MNGATMWWSEPPPSFSAAELRGILLLGYLAPDPLTGGLVNLEAFPELPEMWE